MSFRIAVIVIAVLPIVFSAFIPSEQIFVNHHHNGRYYRTINNTNVQMLTDRKAKVYSTYRKGEGESEASEIPASTSVAEQHGNAMSGGGEKEKGKKKKGGDLLSKILPFMVMPFLISSSMIPMALTSLKMMLLKSLIVGKIAIFLLAVNFLWRSSNKGGVYSHNINIDHDQKDLHEEHYGYNGNEEYGNYVNRRSNMWYR